MHLGAVKESLRFEFEGPMTRMRLLGLVALFGACTGPDTDTDPDATTLGAELTQTGGCADIHVYGENADKSQGLMLTLPSLIDAARDAGTPQTHVFGVTDAGVVVIYDEGFNVTAGSCHDALDPANAPVVDRHYTAVEGTLEVVVTPWEGDFPFYDTRADVSVTFTDVVFESDDGQRATLTSVGFVSEPVGFLPG